MKKYPIKVVLVVILSLLLISVLYGIYVTMAIGHQKDKFTEKIHECKEAVETRLGETDKILRAQGALMKKLISEKEVIEGQLSRCKAGKEKVVEDIR